MAEAHATGNRVLAVLKRPFWLWSVLAIEVLAVHIYTLPMSFTFDRFAFYDLGANFTVQFLVRHGYRPNVDFGYQYGALGILFGRVWFSLLGMTPAAYKAGVVFCDLLFAWGVARFAGGLELVLSGLVFLLVTLPYSLLADVTFCHTLERVLLSCALAEHSRGRRGNALAFATAGVFAKPVMGYVYGALLLVLMVRGIWCVDQPKIRLFARELLPAAATGVLLFGASSLAYGTISSASMLLPLRGARAYRALRVGFVTGLGRSFWYFPGVHVAYYFGSVTALWLVATVLLAVGGMRAAIALSVAPRDPAPDERNHEVVFCCAAMHVAFVTSFFAAPGTWSYYPYVLFMGVAAMSVWGLFLGRVTAGLILLGVLGQKSMLAISYHCWRDTTRSPDTAGLWAPSEERREWTHVLGVVAGHKAVLLEDYGAGALLFEQFEKPVTAYLAPVVAAAGDVDRELLQLSEAEMVVVPRVLFSEGDLAQVFDLPRVFNGWRVRWQGRFFTVYERPALSSRPPGHTGTDMARQIAALAGHQA